MNGGDGLIGQSPFAAWRSVCQRPHASTFTRTCPDRASASRLARRSAGCRSRGADVIFAAHSGLGLAAFPREIWREAPLGKMFNSRMWLSSAAEVMSVEVV